MLIVGRIDTVGDSNRVRQGLTSRIASTERRFRPSDLSILGSEHWVDFKCRHLIRFLLFEDSSPSSPLHIFKELFYELSFYDQYYLAFCVAYSWLTTFQVDLHAVVDCHRISHNTQHRG